MIKTDTKKQKNKDIFYRTCLQISRNAGLELGSRVQQSDIRLWRNSEQFSGRDRWPPGDVRKYKQWILEPNSNYLASLEKGLPHWKVQERDVQQE